MEDLPDYIPPRKKSNAFAWVASMLGLILLNLAANWFTSKGRLYLASNSHYEAVSKG